MVLKGVKWGAHDMNNGGGLYDMGNGLERTQMYMILK